MVVSDASPLICLGAIRHFNLLRLLYGEVLIPEAVWQEITHAPAFATAASLQVAAEARDAGWLQVASAGNRPLVTQLETVLDPGEAEAISLAVERTARRPLSPRVIFPIISLPKPERLPNAEPADIYLRVLLRAWR